MRTSDSIRFGVDRQLVCYGKDGDKTALEIASRLPLSHSNGDGNGKKKKKQKLFAQKSFASANTSTAAVWLDLALVGLGCQENGSRYARASLFLLTSPFIEPALDSISYDLSGLLTESPYFFSQTAASKV